MRYSFLLFAIVLTLTSCVGDDFINNGVDPELRITNPIDTIKLGDSLQYKTIYINNVGVVEEAPLTWSSSNDQVITVSSTGKMQTVAKGDAVVTVFKMVGGVEVADSDKVHVGDTTIAVPPKEKSGLVKTTSQYLLEGAFVLKESGDDLKLEFGADYKASNALPGLFVYLSNNPATVANALEIGAVTVFNGAHSYTIPNTGINDYSYVLYFCKPFNVKVGDGLIQD